MLQPTVAFTACTSCQPIQKDKETKKQIQMKTVFTLKGWTVFINLIYQYIEIFINSLIS